MVIENFTWPILVLRLSVSSVAMM